MHSERGFTLIEMMIALAIAAILMVGIYRVFESQERAYILQDRMAEMNQNARVALEIMSKDIRNAGFDPSWIDRLGPYAGFQSATDQTVVFTQDTDGDGLFNSSGEFLGYRFDAANQQIDRCSGGGACGAWQPFVDRIQNLQFNYVYTDGEDASADPPGLPDDADADDTNDFADIREVEVQVQAVRSGQRDQDADVMGRFTDTTVTSRVKVRNLAFR
jgi:type IV pilus assembly protein PilW